MATLVLRSAGAAIGTALGGPLGGIVGGALGAVGGGVVDGLLANALTSRRNRAPQLDTLAITHAEEGAPVRKLWGRMRVGGNVIRCTQFLAVTSSQKTSSASGKGFGSLHQGHDFRALLRGGLLRGRRRRPPRPRLGRRQRARPQPVWHQLLQRLRKPGAGRRHRGRRGRRRRAGLSRDLLSRVQPHAARRFRQPHAADHRRDPAPAADARPRRRHQHSARRLHAARRRRVRAGHAGLPVVGRLRELVSRERPHAERHPGLLFRPRPARCCRAGASGRVAGGEPGSARISAPAPARSSPRSRPAPRRCGRSTGRSRDSPARPPRW